ncbi:succinate receptor 1-like [Tachysurus fulvidraco]|uniref:succinate receptor 1-like n=1 Tax=Tachysurus fulvidraco TaxID=1234273 RepID=UPI001FEF6235|nr:succinate receptor 1-like [Tachysurus fulvidraco]
MMLQVEMLLRESNCSEIPKLLLKYYVSPVYAVEFAAGFLGNLFVILGYVFCLPSWKSTNVYMFNLAISDFVCLGTLPLLSYNYSNDQQLRPVGCVVVRYILHVNLYTSIIFMAWVGVDRSLLVWYPQRNHFLLTWKASLFISFLNWIWVTLELTPFFVFIINDLKESNWTNCKDFASMSHPAQVLTYNLLLTTVAYVLPLLTLHLFSSRMVSLLKKREEVLGTSFRKPMSIVKAATVMLFVLYMPFHLMRIVRLASRLPGLGLLQCTQDYIEAAYIITRPIAFAHSVINPVFYVLMTDRFRELLQEKWQQFVRTAKLRRLS